ncbi:single-stranded DNA-binding protein [Ignavibacteria bacterium CHB1]|nr:MAG: single-stranded DNA-binding protein [Chlorobiota bacterium]MCE7953499.1 single-stranded DNA-binding protein [Chlorobi bacterium CHB7]MDL1887611.1 single-stranded DNA-binding protein [Ignavibacteria bacterium CHB1]RIK49319.1 MAG: single-stranded DNA-binding protein [Ignavibacteriota bacterium]
MPELNSVIIAGNLTKDPIFRQTTNGTPVVNFSIASNRRFRDKNEEWKEDVCYVGIVAWNRLAESCRDKLKKGNAVLVDGELQSRTFKTEDGSNRTIVEIKARRIQFLNKRLNAGEDEESTFTEHDDDMNFTDDSFDNLLSPDESDLIKSDEDNPDGDKPTQDS